jgi:hypothetical protein
VANPGGTDAWQILAERAEEVEVEVEDKAEQ